MRCIEAPFSTATPLAAPTQEQAAFPSHDHNNQTTTTTRTRRHFDNRSHEEPRTQLMMGMQETPMLRLMMMVMGQPRRPRRLRRLFLRWSALEYCNRPLDTTSMITHREQATATAAAPLLPLPCSTSQLTLEPWTNRCRPNAQTQPSGRQQS